MLVTRILMVGVILLGAAGPVNAEVNAEANIPPGCSVVEDRTLKDPELHRQMYPALTDSEWILDRFHSDNAMSPGECANVVARFEGASQKPFEEVVKKALVSKKISLKCEGRRSESYLYELWLSPDQAKGFEEKKQKAGVIDLWVIGKGC